MTNLVRDRAIDGGLPTIHNLIRPRQQAILLAVVAGLFLLVTPLASASPDPTQPKDSRTSSSIRPDSYIVSTDPGVLPEGIGLAPDRRTMYVSSSGTGAIYRGDVRHRRLRVFAPAGDGGRTSAASIHLDRRGRVFVAGRGALDVYAPNGRRLAHRPAPVNLESDPFLNDLTITPDAVYVTDSANAAVYRATLTGSRIGPLRPWFDARTVQPEFPTYYWYLNGVVADPAGRVLLVAAQGIGALIRVDVATTTGTLVDTAGVPLGADGLLLKGRHTLYAVLNYEPPTTGTGVYEVHLSTDWRTASGPHRVPDSGLTDPTTLALDDQHRLLVVNSQLDSAPGTPPFTVTALPRRPR